VNRQELESFLIDLNRGLRVFSFYPLSHPVTGKVAEELYQKVDSLIKKYDKLIELEISRNSFSAEGETIENHPALSPLAYEFFKRRIKKLFILPGVTPQEIKSLLLALSMDIDTIERSGGIDKILIQYKVQNIWINEIDFSLRQELKEQGPPVNLNNIIKTPRTDTAESKELQNLLNSLQDYIDTPRFKEALKRIRRMVLPFIESKDWYQVLSVLEVLSHIASSPYISDESREVARKTILSIVNRDVIEFLLQEYLASPPLRAHEIVLIFQQLGKISFPFILRELMENEDKSERKKLIQLSSKMGKPILDYLYRLLEDKRWYILRNVLLIIGEIEDPESLPFIEDFLYNPDLRVSREAIRAYTRISQSKGIEKLREIYRKSPKEKKKIIINSLKMIRDDAALDFAVELFDLEKNRELKEAIVKNIPYLKENDKATNFLKSVILKDIKKISGKPGNLALAGIEALSKMGEKGLNTLEELKREGRGKLRSHIDLVLKNERTVS